MDLFEVAQQTTQPQLRESPVSRECVSPGSQAPFVISSQEHNASYCKVAIQNRADEWH